MRVMESRDADDARPDRLAARVFLLDPGDRVLLMRYDDAPPTGVHWATPGGGLDPGEDYPAAALRELAEETGWADIALGPEIHRDTRLITFTGRTIRQHERLFLARTGHPRREIRGVDAMHASDGIAAWHWWTVAELEATTATVWPVGLAGLIRAQLAS
jgi:ADP-ribose pyrophosphatase YjhB (NUDIX family)